jgi:hypothetical protein
MPPDPCPPHAPVTQKVITPDGIIRTVRMCSKCGVIL